MAYIRFEAPAVPEGQNPVSAVCHQLSAANVGFGCVKEDRTAPGKLVVKTREPDAVRKTMRLQAV